MSRDILPSKKKIQTFIFGGLLILILNLISDSIQLNEKANKALTNLLNIPSNFLSQVLRDYQEFENERIAHTFKFKACNMRTRFNHVHNFLVSVAKC